MTVVDIYCRTDTSDSEAQNKLTQQEAACRAYCQDHGLTIGLVHAEVASGAFTDDREKLSLLRERYREQLIQSVVMTDLCRLARTFVELYVLTREMNNTDITLFCVKDDGISTYMRSLIDSIVNKKEVK